MEPELKTELNRLHIKLDRLNKMVSDMRKDQAPKQTWVKVGTIQHITVWDDKRKLERARREGLLKQRKVGNGIEYLLESIPEIFIKKNPAK